MLAPTTRHEKRPSEGQGRARKWFGEGGERDREHVGHTAMETKVLPVTQSIEKDLGEDKLLRPAASGTKHRKNSQQNRYHIELMMVTATSRCGREGQNIADFESRNQ